MIIEHGAANPVPRKRCSWSSGISRSAVCALLATFAWADVTHASPWWQRSRLLSAKVGGGFSQTISDVSRGGYRLSDGTPVSFEDWYSSDWKNLSVLGVTGLDENVVIYWGFSTGERGEKYWIEPSMTLGGLRRFEIDRHSDVSVSAFVTLGGRLKERSCAADYGSIGGRQDVNCRLAASTMPPEKTLDELFDEPPADQFRAAIRYTLRF